jgi:hypothetical protein
MDEDTPDDETDEPVSDGVEEGDLDRPLLDILGVVPEFAPDHLSPPVDERRLLAFIRNEVSPDDRSEIFELVTSFRPWFSSWRLLMRRESGSH